MEYLETMTMEELIEKAKRKVEYQVSGKEWVEATPSNSYNDNRYKVTIYVSVGSPPKGYIIASWGLHEVVALDTWFR
jgi:hypothetical protein